MPTYHEFVKEWHASLVLVAMRRKGRPIRMHEFAHAAAMNITLATPLRRRLEHWGFIVAVKVDPESASRAAALDIALTPEGEEIARVLERMEPVLVGLPGGDHPENVRMKEEKRRREEERRRGRGGRGKPARRRL